MPCPLGVWNGVTKDKEITEGHERLDELRENSTKGMLQKVEKTPCSGFMGGQRPASTSSFCVPVVLVPGSFCIRFLYICGSFLSGRSLQARVKTRFLNPQWSDSGDLKPRSGGRLKSTAPAVGTPGKCTSPEGATVRVLTRTLCKNSNSSSKLCSRLIFHLAMRLIDSG